ncbi:MAG: hypothetical protein E5Y73_14815 [Mesorhizobium sp.]|uniref:hypothetical protein n=1 Tax=Mesorhizobium sp. TaxID=1871066 RepID=UPI00120F0859|nr:hypothetical protein [Mesorhizobium sp.]TIL93058.1 MAG: hypothetical protein E5Y73_14815 [Mesorhizobium sp.]
MDFKTLLNTIRKPKSGREEIEVALAKLDVDAAERAAEDLEAERRDLLVSGDDKDLAIIEERIAAANRVIERSIAMRRELERRLADIRDEEIEAERRQRFEAAKAATAEAGKALARYPKLAREILDVLEAVAIAEVAIEVANKQLPAGETRLRSAEHLVRGFAGAPRETVSEERSDRWFYAGDKAAWGAVEESLIGDIKANGRTGELVTNGGSRPVQKKTIQRRVFLEAQAPDRITPLAAVIRLPALSAGATDLWSPCGPDGVAYLVGEGCHRVVEAVAARRAEAAQKPVDKLADDRNRIIEETIVADDQAEEEAA